MGIRHRFLTVTGSDDTEATWHSFWSGLASDPGEFAIFGGLVSLCRQHYSRAKYRCRIDRYTDHIVYRKRYPDLAEDDENPRTADEFAENFRRARRILARRVAPVADTGDRMAQHASHSAAGSDDSRGLA